MTRNRGRQCDIAPFLDTRLKCKVIPWSNQRVYRLLQRLHLRVLVQRGIPRMVGTHLASRDVFRSTNGDRHALCIEVVNTMVRYPHFLSCPLLEHGQYFDLFSEAHASPAMPSTNSTHLWSGILMPTCDRSLLNSGGNTKYIFCAYWTSRMQECGPYDFLA